MKTTFSHIFYQPYPCEVSRAEKAGLTLGISLFVFLFLWLFAPFGLNEYRGPYRLLICFGYGGMCAAAMGINYYLLMPNASRLFDESKWTVGRQILWTAWILIVISLFNSIYSAIIGIFPFSLYQLIISMLQVILVGIFPVAAIVMLDYLRLFRKHAKRADVLKKKLATHSSSANSALTLIAENKNDRLQLKLGELLYLTSADNYVEVIYRLESGLENTLLRGTLKKFGQQLTHPAIVRCHRSYVVNLSQVINISGNAQGYVLKLRGNDDIIPVSRSYADQVLSRLEHL